MATNLNLNFFYFFYNYSGEVSSSGKSTPDSSHSNSPELKRKLLDLSTPALDVKSCSDRSPGALNQAFSRAFDKSPLQPIVSPGFQRAGSILNYERPSSNQSSKAGTPTSDVSSTAKPEPKTPVRKAGKGKSSLKLHQTTSVSGTVVSTSIFFFTLKLK